MLQKRIAALAAKEAAMMGKFVVFFLKEENQLTLLASIMANRVNQREKRRAGETGQTERCGFLMSSRCRVLIITLAAAGRRGKNSLIKGDRRRAVNAIVCARARVRVRARLHPLLINKTNRRILGA